MNEVIFIDTSAFLAQSIEADHYHQDARRFWSSFSNKPRLLTTSFVVGETFTLMRRWAGYQKAIRFLSYLQEMEPSGQVAVVWPGQDAASAAISLLAQFPDQDLSYVDAVSLVVCMRHPQVREAFSFDHHLGLTGLMVVPGLVGHGK